MPDSSGLPVTRRAALRLLAGIAGGCAACGACRILAGESEAQPPKPSGEGNGHGQPNPGKDGKKASAGEGAKDNQETKKRSRHGAEAADSKTPPKPGQANQPSGRKVKNLLAVRNGQALEIEDPPCFLIRTDLGLAALKTICTHKHQDLMLNAEGTEIHCPLHSSQFSLAGDPIGGPARRPLQWYRVTIDEAGDIFVDAGQHVEKGAGAPLPAWAQPKAVAKATDAEKAEREAR